jgi:hypothetical protein
MTHVLFLAPSLAPISGGGRVLVDWARVAVRMGWRATIATPDGAAPAWAAIGDVEVVQRDAAPAEVDVVLASIWWTAWHCAPWQRRGARAAHLVQGNEQLWATRPEDRRIVRAAHRAIPWKICVSRWVAEACAAPGDTVHVVHPAVAVPVRRRTRPAARPPVVGLPYRNLPEKGWEITEAVVDRLREGPEAPRFRAWGPGAPAALAGRYDDVHEPASDAELLALYDSCDILLYTSWHDGFPLVPLEAMARGMAVVATRSGGIADYADHSRNALMAECGDVGGLAAAVRRLLDDASLRERLAREGTATATGCSAERFAGAARRALAAVAR